jgi:benzoyl-CoA reductase/2-hydroxyglutaryl-CoA dehydratase subunit BcrC/BadD/HgdB
MESAFQLVSEYNAFLEKKKADEKKIIAFLSHDNVPVELFEAAGLVPLPLLFAGKDELMDASHAYLPPSTCSYAQSCIGYFSSLPRNYEFLELADYILLSNHCVSNICVSEILADNFDLNRLDFYVSYTRNANALKYYKIELRNLKENIEEIIGERIPDYKIKEHIIQRNNFKKIVAKVSQLPISGAKKLKLYQKAMLFGPEIQNEIEQFIGNNNRPKSENPGIEDNNSNNINNNAESFKNSNPFSNPTDTKNSGKNVIFTGCSIFIEDYLIDLIESAGGNIVLFDTWIGNNFYNRTLSDEFLNSSQDPIELLTKRFETNIYGDHCVPNSLQNKIDFLDKYVKEYQKKHGEKLAVINHIIKFCDHFSLFQSYFKEKLQERGIQVLNLERDYSRAIRGQLETRIEAFIEMI